MFISAMNKWTVEMKSKSSIAEMDGLDVDNIHSLLK